MSRYQPPADRFGIANNCDPASVDYFIKIFGFKEALELSNIDNPAKNTVDGEKIQLALNDAAQLINNYITTAPYQGKLLIAGAYRRTQAILARCYLDSLRPRQAVTDACEKALQQMELWASKSQPTAAYRFQEAQQYWGKGGFIRADYNRGRSFTEASMMPWQALQGSNNRLNRLVPLEPYTATRQIACGGNDASYINNEPVGEIDISLTQMNDLVSNLEQTRQLGNFADTQNIGNNPIENEDLVAVDENLEIVTTSNSILLEGDEY